MFLNKTTLTGTIALVLIGGAMVLAYQTAPPSGDSPTKGAASATNSEQMPPSEPVVDWVAGWPELFPPRDQSPQTKAILGALEIPIAMNFPNDTALEDLLKYIKKATESPLLPQGIPIYVDPQGLQDADKTIASTVSIDLDRIPLNLTLKLALKQIGLIYRVKDGLLIIHSLNGEDPDSPISILEGKARRGELTRVQYLQLIEMLRLRNKVIEVNTVPTPNIM